MVKEESGDIKLLIIMIVSNAAVILINSKYTSVSFVVGTPFPLYEWGE